MQKVTRFFAGCIVVCLLLLGGAWFYEHHQDSSSSTDVTAENPSITPKASALSLDTNSLGSGIHSLIAGRPDLDMSVSVTDLQTGQNYHYGDDAAFTAASIDKLVTAVTFLHEVELGQMSLDTRYGDDTGGNQIQKMLVNSDNTAWHYMEMAVTLDTQQAYTASLGLGSYNAQTNTITSNDIALLLKQLASYSILNNSDTDLMLSYMQQANYRDYIVAAIPAGTMVYHKVGLLNDRLLDSAIIKQGNRSYVLVIFSKATTGGYDFTAGATLFGAITRQTLQLFFKTS